MAALQDVLGGGYPQSNPDPNPMDGIMGMGGEQNTETNQA